MSPNHRCHPCVKWVSHHWRSHYLWSECACVPQHFGYHPHRSQWLCNTPRLLIISSRAFAWRAPCISNSISNNPCLIQGEKQIPPSSGNALVSGDRYIILLNSSGWAVHLLDYFPTPFVHYSCLLARNKRHLWSCYHTEFSLDCLRGGQSDSKDVDSQVFKLYYMQFFKFRLGLYFHSGLF